LFFFASRRRHTRFSRDWSSDVCSSDLINLDRHKLWLLPVTIFSFHRPQLACHLPLPVFAAAGTNKYIASFIKTTIYYLIIRNIERHIPKLSLTPSLLILVGYVQLSTWGKAIYSIILNFIFP